MTAAYETLCESIYALAGETHMRMCETPLFLGTAEAAALARAAQEIALEALSPAVQAKMAPHIPPAFIMPSAPPAPTFFIIDFARTAEGFRLIELQAFASNLYFIPEAAKIYREVYGTKGDVLLCPEEDIARTILNGHAPEHVPLVEINPWQQKSQRDFVVTRKKLGIPVLDVTEIIKEENRLFYIDAKGIKTSIKRIYNRIIASEFEDLKLAEKAAFRFDEKLDVEWAGDPSWFLRVSKGLLPFLKHPLVPETMFADGDIPDDLENYVLKPAFRNAGLGVKLNVTRADINALPQDERQNWLLMRRVEYAPFITAPDGSRRSAEIRVMLVSPDGAPIPAVFSARLMRGNDVNANLEKKSENFWCGLAPVFVTDAPSALT